MSGAEATDNHPRKADSPGDLPGRICNIRKAVSIRWVLSAIKCGVF